MWSTRKKFQIELGKAFLNSNHYVFLSSIFVESAALYSLFAVPLLVTYGIDHPTSQIWLGLAPAAQVSCGLIYPLSRLDLIVFAVQMISNYLIVYRVAQNRSWEATTATLTLDWPQQKEQSTDPSMTTTLPSSC